MCRYGVDGKADSGGGGVPLCTRACGQHRRLCISLLLAKVIQVMRARPPLPTALSISKRQIVSYPSALFISLIGDLPHVMVIWNRPIERLLPFI